MAEAKPSLIYCAGGNPRFAQAAVDAGWLYGARLPATVYQPVYFADQEWKNPDREAYMAALAKHQPTMATVLDWERDEQLPEVLSWAEQASQYVRQSVVIIPKVVGGIPLLPSTIGGKRIVLGYSVPTSYGCSPVPIWDHAGWPIHLLGGSPQEQMRLWHYFAAIAEVVSADSNMAAMQARKGRTWTRTPGRKGHWRQLSDLGDDRESGVDLECFCRSLAEISVAWGMKRTVPSE